MGIDFSHCEAHWSYSGFSRFRICLAAVIKLNLAKMNGHGGTENWEQIKDDIVPLLHHSDCDGELTSDECKEVAPRLRQLVSNWSDDDYDKIHALDLADGMDAAASQNESLEFL